VVIGGCGEQVEDLAVGPEARDVLERQVHRSSDSTVGAERAQLVELTLLTCHDAEPAPRH